jgi:hypothetical protein
MGRIAQAGFNKSVEQRLQELQKQLADVVARIAAIEAKRGPGRPRIEREPDSGNRTV